jgi:hypothetical protein
MNGKCHLTSDATAGNDSMPEVSPNVERTPTNLTGIKNLSGLLGMGLPAGLIWGRHDMALWQRLRIHNRNPQLANRK